MNYQPDEPTDFGGGTHAPVDGPFESFRKGQATVYRRLNRDNRSLHRDTSILDFFVRRQDPLQAPYWLVLDLRLSRPVRRDEIDQLIAVIHVIGDLGGRVAVVTRDEEILQLMARKAQLFEDALFVADTIADAVNALHR